MRARGFTLLELIVVLAIFGLMSVMAYGGLSSVLKTRVHVEKSLERTGEYQKAFMRMRNDFQQVHFRAVRDGFGSTQPAFIGDTYSHVTFTRGGWRNPLSQPRASLERVVYYLDTDKKALIRSSFRALDQSQDSKPVDVALLENVTELNWRYLDKSREWQTSWPPASASNSTSSTAGATPSPPLAVEVTLRTDDMGELRFLFNLGLDQRPPSFQAGLSGGGGGGDGKDEGTKDPNEDKEPETDNPGEAE